MPKSGPFIANLVKGNLTIFLATLGEEKIFFMVSCMVGSLGFFSFPKSNKCVGVTKGMLLFVVMMESSLNHFKLLLWWIEYSSPFTSM